MQVEFTYLPEQQILVVRTSGDLPSSSWPDVIRMANDEGKARSCLRFLVDHREATFHFRFADIWILPRNAGRFKVPADARVALLLPHPHSTQKVFVEAFMGNRGFRLKLFDDTKTAVDWLLEPLRSNPLTSF